MVFVLLFLSSFFFKSSFSAIVFEDAGPYKCDGNVPYNKAPIKFYYNTTSRFCLATRGGCEGQQMKPLYDSIEDCISKEFANGYTKSGTARCYPPLYGGKAPITFPYGSKNMQSPYLMSRCYPEERMCPDGSGCFFEKATSIATCCSLTKSGGQVAHKWSKANL